MAKGIPVVLTDNATPFVSVTEGAPLATVSQSGFGMPITLVASGAPSLVISGFEPVQSFAMITAGTNFAGNVTGFSDGRMSDPHGTKNGEPMRGVVMKDISTTIGNLQITVSGNLQELQDKSIWVDDTEYAPTVDWYAFSELFACEVWPKPFDFIDGQAYKIEIK